MSRRRQYASPAERQAAYRDRKRNDNPSVTEAIAAAIGTSVSTMRLVERVVKADPSYEFRLRSGEITAHAAALELGLMAKRVSVSTTDVSSAVGVLLKYYSGDQILMALVHHNAFVHWDNESEESDA